MTRMTFVKTLAIHFIYKCMINSWHYSHKKKISYIFIVKN